MIKRLVQICCIVFVALIAPWAKAHTCDVTSVSPSGGTVPTGTISVSSSGSLGAVGTAARFALSTRSYGTFSNVTDCSIYDDASILLAAGNSTTYTQYVSYPNDNTEISHTVSAGAASMSYPNGTEWGDADNMKGGEYYSEN